MNCDEFGRWLDQGFPAVAGTARDHASLCVHCARALAATESLERMLAAPPARTAPDFTDAVMARIAAPVEPAAAPFALPALPAFSMPWWLRAAAEPAAALALLLSGVVVWLGERAFGVADVVATAAGGATIAVGAGIATSPVGPLLSESPVRFGLLLALALVLALLAGPITRWTERVLVALALPRADALWGRPATLR